MSGYCHACHGESYDNGVCKKTNKFGVHCYTCGRSGHVSSDKLDNYGNISTCACGESDVYVGSLERLSGIATGALSPVGARTFRWI